MLADLSAIITTIIDIIGSALRKSSEGARVLDDAILRHTQDTDCKMATAHFKITEHVIPASHIREYPRALSSDNQEDTLQLAIKQYTPKKQPTAGQGELTLIGGHANGFPKELYEPLWDDLHERLLAKNIRISSIWIADVTHQGQSGVLNEHKLGDDPSWMDHPRDLFLMVNHFSKQMRRPIFGVGHSMGGNNLVNLSLMHARLFASLVLIDPVIQRLPSPRGNYGPAKASTKRRDRWASRREAEEKFGKSPFYQTWDPRVLDRWLDYGLRELPTAIYPGAPSSSKLLPTVSADPGSAAVEPEKTTERELTLTTTKHQEVMTFLRANFPSPEYPSPDSDPDPLTHPDVDVAAGPNAPFYRPEPLFTFTRLPHLRPSVLYVFGDRSDLSAPDLQRDKLGATGVGVGGSGGVAKGRVASVTFAGVGHLIPMEVVGQTADAIAGWVEPELRRYRENEERERERWRRVPRQLRNQLSPEYVAVMTSDWTSALGDGGTGKSRL